MKFPQSVMIWAAMSSAGVGPLCFLKSTVNAAIYQEILEHFKNLTKIVLQIVQNAVARVLTRLRRYDHITLILQSLHWLPIKFRISYKILLLTYKALNGLAPAYLTSLLSRYNPTRSLRSQNSGLLVVPRITKSTKGGRTFSYLAPKLWNSLPDNVPGSEMMPTPQTIYSLSFCNIYAICYVYSCNDCIVKSTMQIILNLEFMLPSADKLYGDADLIFQQDLAPTHTANFTKSWFNDHGVTVLDWPANSADQKPHRKSMGYCQEEDERHQTQQCR